MLSLSIWSSVSGKKRDEAVCFHFVFIFESLAVAIQLWSDMNVKTQDMYIPVIGTLKLGGFYFGRMFFSGFFTIYIVSLLFLYVPFISSEALNGFLNGHGGMCLRAVCWSSGNVQMRLSKFQRA